MILQVGEIITEIKFRAIVSSCWYHTTTTEMDISAIPPKKKTTKSKLQRRQENYCSVKRSDLEHATTFAHLSICATYHQCMQHSSSSICRTKHIYHKFAVGSALKTINSTESLSLNARSLSEAPRNSNGK